MLSLSAEIIRKCMSDISFSFTYHMEWFHMRKALQFVTRDLEIKRSQKYFSHGAARQTP